MNLTPREVIDLIAGFPHETDTVDGVAMVKMAPLGIAPFKFTKVGSRVTVGELGGPLQAETITREQWAGRIRTAAAVAWAASAGNPKHRSGTAATGGISRGLFGLSTNRFGNVPDADADNPDTAAMIVYLATRNLTRWDRFAGNPGLVATGPAAKVIADAWAERDAELLDKIKTAGTAATGAIKDAAGVLDWAQGLASLLGNLLDPEWWRRIGIGALGLLLVIIAVALSLATNTQG